MWWLWAGCQLVQETLSPPPIPRATIERLAPDILKLGHPNGALSSVRLASWENGAAESHQRWVDVAIAYTRREGREAHAMTVRLYVERADPCKVSTDVLQDDGPDPLLLDNSLASAALGTAICDAMAGEP